MNTLLTDSERLRALFDAAIHDPFAFLGPHPLENGYVVRVFVPGALSVSLISAQSHQVIAEMNAAEEGLFISELPKLEKYYLRIQWPGDNDKQVITQETEDPYAFGLLLGPLDLYLIGEGRHLELATCLGAQLMTVDDVQGVRFSVWAPNARRVSVIGDFNSWDGRRHPMRCRIEAGVWELFIPRLQAGALYKFELLGAHGLLPQKSDPVALQVETPPRTAAIVTAENIFQWNDEAWMQQRESRQTLQSPISIYEVHAGSWRYGEDEHHLQWDELAEQLIPYVIEQGFTHIEFLPLTAHPFRGSWGYQPLNLFAPHPEYGTPEAFASFVNRCHAENIGVILDWVPAHFPTDAHGLAHFDGTPLYEHADPREGFHQDWNTLIYNLGRHEVRGFLMASALHWLEKYHIDGLRVDAVASLLYRDYSRREGEWIPNQYGGRENIEAIHFLRELNDIVKQRCPGALMIAEESTAWPGVTHDTHHGGLGFSYKWNMGWMHDTLQYIGKDPVYRTYDHNKITFGLVYAFSENFLLPLSHDEVVHGKGSLIAKMPGDYWQKFANLRGYLAFMWAHPGKKLLFMGGEIAQFNEWNHDTQLDWGILGYPLHKGVQKLIADLNKTYVSHPALHSADNEAVGFHWIIGDDSANSVFAFYRAGENDETPPVLIICNFTPVTRQGYRVGAPRAGIWREIINTDAEIYGGSNTGNGGQVMTVSTSSHNQPFSLILTLPPLAVVMFVFEGQPKD